METLFENYERRQTMSNEDLVKRTELAQNGGLSLGHSYATITMPDSFRVLLDQYEQKQYENEFPIRRPDGSEVDGKEEDDGES